MNDLYSKRTSSLKRREYKGRAFWLSSEQPHARLPTVVLLHGLGNSLDFWTAVAPIIGRTTQVLALDIPGFGKSQPPRPDFTLSAICDPIWDLIQYIGARSVLLVGHSLGGYVALSLAKDAPVPIHSITLVSATLFRAEAILRNPRSAIRSPRLFFALCAQFAGGAIPFSDRTAKLVAGNRWSRQALLWPFVARPKLLNAGLAMQALSGNSGRSIGATLRVAQRTCLSTLSQGLHQRIALVWGDRDYLIDAEDIMYARRFLKHSSELCLPNTGHWPMLEEPHLLANFVLEEWSES